MPNRNLLLSILLVLAAGCGGESYTPTTKKPAKPAEYTGILLNCQRPPTMTPFKATLDQWKVVDPAGKVLFSSDDVPESNLRGVAWAWKREQVTGMNNLQALGRNPLEIKMTKDEYSDDYKSGTFYVSDATAAEIRARAGKIQQLLHRWNIVILVGKLGE